MTKNQVRIFNTVRFAVFTFAITISTPHLAETSDQITGVTCDATMMTGTMEQLSATHATIVTSILIDASVADVWAILTDFKKMSDWSSGTLQGMTGDIQSGGRVTVPFLFGLDENGAPIANEILHTLVFEEGVKFGWSDPLSADIGGGHDNHIYRVEPCEGKALFVQSDEIVNNPYAANFAMQLLPMYQLFNTELGATVESK